VVGVGFESLEQTQWWIYPNPSRGMLMLSGVAATSACLIDLWGRRVFLNVPSSSSLGDALGMGDQALDLGNVTSGVYWLELYGEQNRFLGRRKLIRIMD
ncbi:MAG: T9SS C-terminal target domain-containing protein, partial [Cytophagia bacterium]|nr:T9SS C-terminal target domain-containing protein [Cytophagia bacterium]